jgi:hypothetical protein
MQNLPPVMINHFSRFVFLNLKRNWLSYLVFTSLLYLFTPFTFQLNTWPTIKAIDNVMEYKK